MLVRLHPPHPMSVATLTTALLLASPIAGVFAAGAQEGRPKFAAHPAEARGDALPTAVEVAGSIDSLRGRLERLAEREAKQFYLGCSGAAMRGRLSGDETAACSVGYEVLLQRHFGGDFHALLAWSRSQPHDSVDRPARESHH